MVEALGCKLVLKEVTIPLLEEVHNRIPIVFDDIWEKCNGEV